LSLTQLWWGDLENLVPGIIKAEYEQLSDAERKVYLRDLKEADTRRLENYSGRRKGETYALWHHLLRMENTASAIRILQDLFNANDQYRRLKIKSKIRILDVGSGTGSGIMALTFVYAKTRTNGTMNFYFTLIEPFLNSVGDRILEKYADLFWEKSDANAQFTCEHWEGVRNFQECASAESEEPFNLILFSHTFDKERPEDWLILQGHIKKIADKHLAPDGIVIFLTPQDPPEKISQVKSLVETLKYSGYEHIEFDPDGFSDNKKKERYKKYNLYQNKTYSSSEHSLGFGQRNPKSLVEIREWFVAEGNRLGIQNVFDLDEQNGIPYYSFTCRIDCIFKPVVNDDIKA